MMTVEQPPRLHPFFRLSRLGSLISFFSSISPFLMIYEASAFGSGLSHLACYPLLSLAHSNPTN